MILRRFVGFGRLLGWCIPGGGPDNFANAIALAFDAVHEAPCPDKLRGEKAESQKDDNPAGTGSDQHDHADEQQREAANDARETANLFNGA